MKLCSFVANGAKRIGTVLRDGKVIDGNAAYAALLESKGSTKYRELADTLVPPEMVPFLEGGDESLEAMRDAERFVEETSASTIPGGKRIAYNLPEVRLSAPIPKPGKIICSVLNDRFIWRRIRTWEDRKRPKHPYYFLKATNAVVGPDDPIQVPRLLTWPEVELAWIFYKKAKSTKASDFRDYIVGFTVLNDVTAGGLHSDDTVRYINPDGSEGLPFRPMTRYKGYDTFAPMGPWIVTRDEISNPNNLAMKCWIDDLLVQDGSTKDLVNGCEALTEYITSFHTLMPGDIISGGTCRPARGRTLRDNDLEMGKVCRCEIEKIGSLRNPIRL